MTNNELYVRAYEKGKTKDGSFTDRFMRILHMDPERRFMLYQASNASISFNQKPEFTQSNYMSEQDLETGFKQSGYIGKYGLPYSNVDGAKKLDGIIDKPNFILYHSPLIVEAGLFQADGGKVPPTEEFGLYTREPRQEAEPGFQYTSDQIKTVYSDPKRVVRQMRDRAMLELSQYGLDSGITVKDAIEKFLTTEKKLLGNVGNPESIGYVPQEFQAEVREILENLSKELEPQDNAEREKLNILKAKQSEKISKTYQTPPEEKLKLAEKIPTRKMLKNPNLQGK